MESTPNVLLIGIFAEFGYNCSIRMYLIREMPVSLKLWLNLISNNVLFRNSPIWNSEKMDSANLEDTAMTL